MNLRSQESPNVFILRYYVVLCLGCETSFDIGNQFSNG